LVFVAITLFSSITDFDCPVAINKLLASPKKYQDAFSELGFGKVGKLFLSAA
jgi:hypothetical protein